MVVMSVRIIYTHPLDSFLTSQTFPDLLAISATSPNLRSKVVPSGVLYLVLIKVSNSQKCPQNFPQNIGNFFIFNSLKLLNYIYIEGRLNFE